MVFYARLLLDWLRGALVQVRLGNTTFEVLLAAGANYAMIALCAGRCYVCKASVIE